MLQDPFILHTLCEEYIAPDIGSDPFTNIDKFLVYAPDEYKTVLQNSHGYISKINELYKSIQTLNISSDCEHKSSYSGYDSDSDYESPLSHAKCKLKYEIAVPNKHISNCETHHHLMANHRVRYLHP